MTPNDWILGNDMGISSRTIWAVMMGEGPPHWHGTPSDPDDFGRCWRLLARFPEWRRRLPEVAERHPEWSGLVREWDRLSRMYEAVIEDGDWNLARSKLLYDAMRELIRDGRRAAGWVEVRPGVSMKIEKRS